MLAGNCKGIGNPVKPSQTACSVELTLAHQRNAIQMAFRLRADSGPLFDVYWVVGHFSHFAKN